MMKNKILKVTFIILLLLSTIVILLIIETEKNNWKEQNDELLKEIESLKIELESNNIYIQDSIENFYYSDYNEFNDIFKIYSLKEVTVYPGQIDSNDMIEDEYDYYYIKVLNTLHNGLGKRYAFVELFSPDGYYIQSKHYGYIDITYIDTSVEYPLLDTIDTINVNGIKVGDSLNKVIDTLNKPYINIKNKDDNYLYYNINEKTVPLSENINDINIEYEGCTLIYYNILTEQVIGFSTNNNESTFNGYKIIGKPIIDIIDILNSDYMQLSYDEDSFFTENEIVYQLDENYILRLFFIQGDTVNDSIIKSIKIQKMIM